MAGGAGDGDVLPVQRLCHADGGGRAGSGCQPNTEAWERWKAEHPAPEPGPEPTEVTMEDVVEMLVEQEVRLATLEMMGGEMQ